MKNVINWKTTSSSGVRFGSAFILLDIDADMGWNLFLLGPGQAALTALAAATRELIVRSATRVASMVDLGDSVAEECEEEDGRHGQAHAFERDEESRRDALGDLFGLRLGAAALAISWKLMIMPQIVPTRPIIGPSVPIIAR